MVSPETIKLLGNRLCLHFANSVDWTAEGAPIPATDALTEPDAVDRWGVRMGLGSAGGDLAAARGFRAALYSLFAEDADPAPLAALYAEAVSAGRLTSHDDHYAFEWPPGPRSVLYAVAADAVALLGDPALLARVHRCPGRDCGWLFLDTSGRRRWCSMSTCGSREKMRRMYARQRAA